MKEISSKACPGGVVIGPPALAVGTSAKLKKKKLTVDFVILGLASLEV
jgi:hypothetical protein